MKIHKNENEGAKDPENSLRSSLGIPEGPQKNRWKRGSYFKKIVKENFFTLRENLSLQIIGMH